MLVGRPRALPFAPVARHAGRVVDQDAAVTGEMRLLRKLDVGTDTHGHHHEIGGQQGRGLSQS